LRRASERRQAAAAVEGDPHTVTVGAVFISAQLVLGPYTNILYLSGWLLVALATPVLMRGLSILNNLLLAAGLFNASLFAVPGRMNQRAIAAAAVYGLLGIVLWAVVMRAAWVRVRPAIP
jgi:hypothetical protein